MKVSDNLVVENDYFSVDVMMCDSGEVELVWGIGDGKPVSEHFDIGEEDFHVLMQRVLGLLETGKFGQMAGDGGG